MIELLLFCIVVALLCIAEAIKNLKIKLTEIYNHNINRKENNHG